MVMYNMSGELSIPSSKIYLVKPASRSPPERSPGLTPRGCNPARQRGANAVVLRSQWPSDSATVTDAAEALGITRTMLSELVNEKRGISGGDGSTVFGGRAESWMVQQAQYDPAQCPCGSDEVEAAGLGLIAMRSGLTSTRRSTRHAWGRALLCS